MIQLNLLPDVKSKYIKAQRTKRLVLVSSIAISGVSIGIVVLLASVVYGAQKIQLSHYDSEIKKNSAELSKIDGLDKILTIQNQLGSLSSLHGQKPVTSRLFGFITQVTPNDVQISSLNLKFDDSTMQIKGTASSLEFVNKFVDTLKFTTYTTDSNQTETRAFPSVVLSSFSRDDKGASYVIDLTFDPAIFSSDTNTVTLVVPKITSTRADIESPNALFNQQTKKAQ